MSRSVQVGPAPTTSWIVHRASLRNVPGVIVAVQELLLELGAPPPSERALGEVVRELIEDHDAGAVVVACAGGEVVGVLAASWQLAVHVPGLYGTVQDLWVHPAWRSRSIGADLIAALVDLARTRAITRIEVGLPPEHFRALEATEAFYLARGFAPLGPRMRLVLS